jgi:assimilatory nitrate reductase catalytic subunit
MHWNDQFAAAARVGSLVNPCVDPLSGQPEYKHTPVRVMPYRAAWYGFLLTRGEVELREASYWSKARRYGLWHYELAGELSPDNWAACVREQLNAGDTSAEWRELYDSTQIQYRAARIIGGRLDAVIIIGPGFELPPRDWLAALFRKQRLDDSERARLLRATPPSGQQDAGAIVCACFSVGVGTLRRAIREQGLDSPEAIGRALHAGTNCGSCVAELRRLIADAAAQPVA